MSGEVYRNHLTDDTIHFLHALEDDKLVADGSLARTIAMLKTRPHLADQPAAQTVAWPRMAEAWGCPGPESATAGAAWRRSWPMSAALFSS